MKRFGWLLLVPLAVCLVVCTWAEMDSWSLTDSSVSLVATNTSGNAISREHVYGYLYAIAVDLGSVGSPDIDIDIVTTTGETGGEQTLYTADDVTADTGWLFPRFYGHDSSGTMIGPATNTLSMLPLVGDNVELRAYDSNTNAATVEVLFVIEK